MSDTAGSVSVVDPSMQVAIPMSKGKRSALVVAILAAIFAQMFMTYSLTTAAPIICTELTDFQWYAAMFSMATMFQCIFTPAANPLARVFTQRRILVLGLLLFVVQYIGTFLATSVLMIVVFRCIGHIGSALLFTVGLSMFADIYPAKETPKVIGYYGAIMSLTGVVGPIIAGVLCDNVTWRWLPIISLAIAVIAIVMVVVCAPKAQVERDEEKTDVKGILLLSVVVLAVVALFTFAGTYFAWASIITAIIVVVAIVFVVVFVNVEKKLGEGAFIPMDLLKSRVFVAGFMLGFFGDGAAYVLRIYMPAYGQYIMGTSATVSALFVSIPSILAIIVAFALGIWLAKSGRIKLVAYIGIISQILCCLFICIGTPETNLVFYLIVITVLFGLVNGIVSSICLTLVQARMPHRHVAISVAVVQIGITLGCSIVVAIAGAFQNMGWDPVTTYRTIFIVNAVLTCIIFPFLFRLPSDKKAMAEMAAAAGAPAGENTEA